MNPVLYYNRNTNMLRYTRHALLRMQEREIVESEINEVFANRYLTYQGKGTVLIGKTNQERHLTLVINPETQALITLWPSKRKERKLYEEKIAKI